MKSHPVFFLDLNNVKKDGDARKQKDKTLFSPLKTQHVVDHHVRVSKAGISP